MTIAKINSHCKEDFLLGSGIPVNAKICWMRGASRALGLGLLCVFVAECLGSRAWRRRTSCPSSFICFLVLLTLR